MACPPRQGRPLKMSASVNVASAVLLLSIRSFLFSTNGVAVASFVEHDLSPPRLSGEHYRITVVEEKGCFDIHEVDDDGTLSYSGYLFDMLRAIAAVNRANFTYDIVTPSGLGPDCEPQLSLNGSSVEDGLYSSAYHRQYDCGANDVNDLDRSSNFSTDMYLSLYYITPGRQLRNDFSMPYAPPHKGTPGIYGTATGIRDIADLVQQQKEGKQPVAWVPGSTAIASYIQRMFPEIKLKPFFGSHEDLEREIDIGNVEVYIDGVPVLTHYVQQRFHDGACLTASGKPVGLIGEPMQSGLSHFAVGVNKDLPRHVVRTLSYWINILMICDPLDTDGDCPEGNLATFYGQYGGTGRECGYVQYPYPLVVPPLLSKGAIAGVIMAAVALVLFLFSIWHFRKLRQQEKRYKKRFVQQVARNIQIGPRPGDISAEKLCEEILHIGNGKSVICKDDLAQWMNDIKLDFISKKDFEALWHAMDVDGKGEVDPVEFIVFLSACGPQFEKVYNSQEGLPKVERLKLAARRLTNLQIHGEEGVRRMENKLDRSSREMPIKGNKNLLLGSSSRGRRKRGFFRGSGIPTEQPSSRTFQIPSQHEAHSSAQSASTFLR